MFTVVKSDLHGSRPNWNIIDSENRFRSGPYRLQLQAKVMADRWNADPEMAEKEAPLPAGQKQ